MFPVFSAFPFRFFSFVFPIFFLLVIGVFLFGFITAIRRWKKNNDAPRLTVEATVVAKRTDVTHHRQANAGDMTGAHGYMTHTFTTCYVTFEVESGDRMELTVEDSEYGLLAEGDFGKLTFQGTRYLSFVRTNRMF